MKGETMTKDEADRRLMEARDLLVWLQGLTTTAQAKSKSIVLTIPGGQMKDFRERLRLLYTWLARRDEELEDGEAWQRDVEGIEAGVHRRWCEAIAEVYGVAVVALLQLTPEAVAKATVKRDRVAERLRKEAAVKAAAAVPIEEACAPKEPTPEIG